MRLCCIDRDSVGMEKFCRYCVLPNLSPVFEALRFICRTLPEFIQCSIRCITEGAEHSRDISERRLLAPAFGERFGGLAFKVQNDEVFVRAKNLPEMVVAVNANTLSKISRLSCGDSLRPRQQVAATVEHARGVVGSESRQSGQGVLQGL